MPPDISCPRCPRLCDFRKENKGNYPNYHNAPVPSFGSPAAKLLVVGLAPGLHGANATGRPFTGDYAGVILYGALKKHGFAQGEYAPEKFIPPPGGRAAEMRDNFTLLDCRITNAVRCVPPENKPTPEEIRTCNDFLKNEIASMPNLKIILSLGQISHNAVVRALGLKASRYKFAHGAEHLIVTPSHDGAQNEPPKAAGQTPQQVRGDRIILFNSYHTSRYNMNTRVLTEGMFDAVMAQVRELLRISPVRREA